MSDDIDDRIAQHEANIARIEAAHARAIPENGVILDPEALESYENQQQRQASQNRRRPQGPLRRTSKSRNSARSTRWSATWPN